MAETSNGKIEELVAKVKEKCRITWDDGAIDRYIEDELIPSACSVIRFKIGMPEAVETTGSVAEAAAKAEPGLEVRIATSTTVSGEWIGTFCERKFNKGDILFVSISSDTANTT